MCTVITHPAVPIALSVLLPPDAASPSLLIAASVCSMIPDLDVVGFSFGIDYSDMLGHRGFTHSIFFAVAFAALTTLTVFSDSDGSHLIIFLFLFLSSLSHPVLDALTNGGLGVGLFAPFSNKRYFFPYRPIEVSPIGVAGFFSDRGFAVLLSELKWVWFPSSVCFALGQLFKRLRDVI
ncbi:MAG TPA: metal-dependent hydrolase [Candidatus Binatia bacterium]|nr:metal-dependent hydrolase [Candidatus Binatia bacterium]